MKQRRASLQLRTMMRFLMYTTTMLRNVNSFSRGYPQSFHTRSSSHHKFGWNYVLGPSFNATPRARLFLSTTSSTTTTTTTPTTTTTTKDAIDPNSEVANDILGKLGVTDKQQYQLRRLNQLVVEWNQHINLVSRVDCTEEVVFGRHILPSLAISGLLRPRPQQVNDDDDTTTDPISLRVADVGTGGGFPGLPLAILFPHYQFVLVDSVGKKIKVVQDMVNELGLTNVKTHHGRVEEMTTTTPGLVGSSSSSSGTATNDDDQTFHFVLGRSVTSLPKFCFWVQDLLKETTTTSSNQQQQQQGGRLVYIVGGDIPLNVLNRCQTDVPLNELLIRQDDDDDNDISDKRALVLSSKSVKEIARESGEKKRTNNAASSSIGRKGNANKSKNNKKGSKQKSKGHWEKIDNSKPKERGYENFKRYSA